MDDVLPLLDPAEIRVLGSLIEKQITTPDNYPLSLNALTNACNQLTSRDPVVSYSEQAVVRAADGLREKRLATLFHGAESRVAKYRHAIGDVIPLSPRELAVICVLMLRGPQTAGELRTRTERLHRFETLSEVEETLGELAARQPPLVLRLPRQAGAKESRFAHLFSGPVTSAPGPTTAGPTEPAPARAVPVPSAGGAAGDRVALLEEETAALRRELEELRREFAEFRRQFE